MGTPMRPDQVYDPPSTTLNPASQTGLFRRITIGQTVILSPSGDTTGVTDQSNIQNLLNNGFDIEFSAGIFYIATPIQYPGGCIIQGQGYGYGTGTTVRATAAMAAAFESAGWAASSNLFSQAPVQIGNMQIDANNLAGIGLVTQNFRSVFRGLRISSTTGDGLRMDFFGANGTTGITNTCVENRIEECIIDSAGGQGIRSTDPSSTSAITDGWLIDCTVSSAGTWGVNLSASAGWLVQGCHVYGTPGVNAALIECDRPFWTRIIGNLVENLGQPAGVGTYSGIQIGNCQNNNGAVIVGNNIGGGVGGNAGSLIRFIDMDVASGLAAAATIVGNQLTYTGATVGTVNGIVTNNGSAGSTTNVVTNGNQIIGNFSNQTQFNAGGGVVNHSGGL